MSTDVLVNGCTVIVEYFFNNELLDKLILLEQF